MHNRAGVRWMIVASLGCLVLVGGGWRSTRAADLLSAADYLNRQQASLTNGVTHTFFFSPATSMPGVANRFTVVFPKSPVGTWCRVAGTLFVVGVTDPAGVPVNASVLPGALSGSCTIGNGSTTFDTITVTTIGPLSAGVTYGVQISDPGAAKLGTPPPAIGIDEVLTLNDGSSDVDSLLFYANTIPSDRLVVAANVVSTPPTNTNPIVQFRGVGAASGAVTFTRDNVALQTIPTDSGATFDVTLIDQPVGQHVYVVSGKDRDGRDLTPVTFALTLTLNSTTVIGSVFLGPSIFLDKTAVKIGQPVTVSGNTTPSSAVTVVVHSSQPYTYNILSDAGGQWSKILNTQELGIGTHTASARTLYNGSLVSSESAVVSFAVNPQGQCDGKETADLNCDAAVDLTDFSILLYFWQQTNPSNSRADVNGDGRVDVIDFSIMLFQWTA